jgi:RNA recognition motif. (a.k.a. RRM, RBD, or RNP domain)
MFLIYFTAASAVPLLTVLEFPCKDYFRLYNLSCITLVDQRFSEFQSLHSFDFGDMLMSIYVGNLSYDVTKEDLNQAFAQHGAVKQVNLPTDRETGRLRGFAFVEMETEAEETAAIEALDGAEWMGRDLKVNKARPREDRSSFGSGSSRRY